MSCISRLDFDLARAMRYMGAKHLSMLIYVFACLYKVRLIPKPWGNMIEKKI